MSLSRKHTIRTLISLTVLAVGAFISLCFWGATRTPALSQAVEDRHSLWMAALKGFHGQVNYIGEDGDSAYFRTCPLFFPQVFKAPAKEMKVPTRFQLGEGEPYRVEQQMVPPTSPPEVR